MAKRKQTTTYIFEQQLKPDFWDWSEDSKKLFLNWENNKIEIFKEIYERVKSMSVSEDLKIALIIHDKDISYGTKLVEPHIHGYIEFSNKKDLNVLALNLGILPQYIESSGRGKYGKVNSKAYLIHAKDKDKYQYPASDVETFDTFDYEAFVNQNREDFEKYAATKKREKTDESLDMVFQKIITGELTEDDIFDDEELRFLWANNQNKFEEAFHAQAVFSARETMRALQNGEFKLTAIFVHGRSDSGKTTFAKKIGNDIIQVAKEESLDWRMYDSDVTNPFDAYRGEEVILLNDLRYDSLKPADWLKLLDPLNNSRMSARYRNRLVAGRIFILTNTEGIFDFFRQIKYENIDQYLRRFNYVLEVFERGGEREYVFSETIKLSVPNTEKGIVTYFDTKEVYRKSCKDEFVQHILEDYILPRILPKKAKDVTND
ncbi:plasmid replication protein [Streptococcus pseudopneumoniae]|uniref:Rep family protein n=1 Tax=Streptococcus pseudopneumoniae TaxID=257758 RepID=UPI00110C2783|nr:Rep family protein [Streptococcus pseudopneumoniae]TMR83088.1 plasmid replication protein [Streptococcus pseudopneumoniae]